ncbi:MAG: YkgJ family cysteine cluster protein [Candidatus Obscuribacterales bacterium]
MTDKDAQQNDDLKLLIPEEIRYNCQGCGRCCSGWSVGLSEADYSRVKDVDWGSLHPDLANKELFIHRQDQFKQGLAQYPHFTKPRKDGTCPFLIDGLCFIHGHMGEEQKPGTCQIFPYSYVETPTGIYMGLAYNSMASVRNIGELLTDQEEKLKGYFRKTVRHLNARAADRPADTAAGAPAEMHTPANPFDEVDFAAGASVPWSEFLHFDARLTGFLKQAMDEKRNFFDVLVQAEEIVLRATRLAREGKSLSELADYQPDITASGAGNPSGTDVSIIAMIYYLYLVYPTVRSSYEELWQIQGQSFDPRSIMMIGKKFGHLASTGISTILFKKAEIPQIGSNDLSKSLNYKVEPLSPEMNELFCRWLYVKIFGKTYFGPAAAGYSVVSGFNSLVACFVCAMLFAKGEAMKRGEKELKIADLYEAYWRLDREFLTVTQILPQVSAALSIAYSIPRMARRVVLALANNARQ